MGGDSMTDKQKIQNTDDMDCKIDDTESGERSEACCCYVVDPCCCYVMDACGCYVNPCCC